MFWIHRNTFALPGTESFLGLPDRTQIIILSYLDMQYIKTGCHNI